MSLELQEDNIDALFEDLDDAGDFSVPAPIDHDAMAASLARRNPKPIDPFAPSAYDDLADGDGPQADGSKSKRLRRPAVKLDEDRLLNNPAGFKKLVELSKIFEPGPKGSEKEDLKRVLKMYRMWTHALYPKAKFSDAIETIEKLCRKRPLQSALKEWREDASESSNKPRTEAPEEILQTTSKATAEQPADLTPAVQPTSAPLFRKPDEENDEFDIDDDFDQLLQEMDVSGPAPKQTTSTPEPLFIPDPDDDEFAEEEALMREYAEFEAAKASAAAVQQPLADVVQDSSATTGVAKAPIVQTDTGHDADEPDWDDLYS